MLTKYLTSVTTSFSPFNPKSGKTARNFLAMLPPNARSTLAIDVKMLSQAQKSVPATLALKFSAYRTLFIILVKELSTDYMTFTEDGKEMNIDLEKMKIRDIQVEVDRN